MSSPITLLWRHLLPTALTIHYCLCILGAAFPFVGSFLSQAGGPIKDASLISKLHLLTAQIPAASLGRLRTHSQGCHLLPMA